MDENHGNMEESEYNDMTSLWFNNRLFSSNAGPLKFYVEGYGQSEFHEAVQIIDAYGGVLSSPNAPDTFFFCRSDHPVDVEKYDRYDIQYFQDSIIALHPQDLMKYKFRKSQNEESPTLEHEVSCHNRIHQEQTNNSGSDYCIDLCYSDTEDLNKLQDNENSCTTAKAGVPMDRLEKCLNAESPSFEDEVRPPHSETEEENLDKPPKLIKYTLHETIDQPFTSSEEHNDKSTYSHHNGIHHVHHNDSEDDDNVSLSSCDADKVVEQTIKRKCRTSHARVYVERLDGNLIASSRTNLQMNYLNDRYLPEDPRNRPSPPEDDGDSDDSMTSETSGDSDPSQSQSNDMYVPSGHPVSKKMVKKKGERSVSNSHQCNFTEDEDQIIMRWLMERNIRPSKTGIKIWKIFVREKVLPQRDITHWKLQGHFARKLKKHPTFVKWINDMETSGRRFQPTLSPRRFTEDENQTMIKWLMKKNILPSRWACSIWKRFLKEKVLPKRNDLTAPVLASYFGRKLKKHPTFVKWIEDMRASGREFEPASQRPPSYSEEENQIMIQYIIDHDAYKRVLGDRVWLQLLESNKSSLISRRTGNGLGHHFRKFLVKNYAKYTDDPEALKKFKGIALKFLGKESI